MNAKHVSALLNLELKNRGWTIKKLAIEAKVPYETARRAVHGIGSPGLESTNRLLVAINKDMAITEREPA